MGQRWTVEEQHQQDCWFWRTLEWAQLCPPNHPRHHRLVKLNRASNLYICGSWAIRQMIFFFTSYNVWIIRSQVQDKHSSLNSSMVCVFSCRCCSSVTFILGEFLNVHLAGQLWHRGPRSPGLQCYWVSCLLVELCWNGTPHMLLVCVCVCVCVCVQMEL